MQDGRRGSCSVLTVCQTPNDDDSLESSLLLVASTAPLLEVIGTAVDLSVPSLSTALVRVQDTRYRRQHPETNPHLLLLLVSNDFIFEGS